jgi:hypothetical protein
LVSYICKSWEKVNELKALIMIYKCRLQKASDFFFRFHFFCFFSAKLVWTITFLSLKIGQWYVVCGCWNGRTDRQTDGRTLVYHNTSRLTDGRIKNHYLTLRSKVKVPRRLLRYATHRLMVMHPHTIYHWPIFKEGEFSYVAL